MTTSPISYTRSVFTGAVAWMLSAAFLHWLPLPIQVDTGMTPKMAALAVVTCAFFVALVYVLVRRKPPAERFPSTAAMVMPVAFGDAVAVAFFKDFFPKISPAASGMFAALLLLTSAVILATGLVAGRCRMPKAA